MSVVGPAYAAAYIKLERDPLALTTADFVALRLYDPTLEAEARAKHAVAVRERDARLEHERERAAKLAIEHDLATALDRVRIPRFETGTLWTAPLPGPRR